MAGKPSAGMMGGKPYTPPGTVWTAFAHGWTGTPRAVAYAFDAWYVICSDGKLYRSPAGHPGTWTLVQTLTGTISTAAMLFVQGRLVIATLTDIWTSTDGVTFSVVSSYSNIGGLPTMAYGNGVLVVGIFETGSNGHRIHTSDFVTWTYTSVSGVNRIGQITFDPVSAKFHYVVIGAGDFHRFTTPGVGYQAALGGWSGSPSPVFGSGGIVVQSGRVSTLGRDSDPKARNWYTDNTGTSWSQVAISAVTGPRPQRTYLVDTVIWTVVAGTAPDDGLYKSTDNGLTFTNVFNGNTVGGALQDIGHGGGRFIGVTSTHIALDI